MNYQTCYSCGRESPYGQPLAHFDGCHVAKPASAPPADAFDSWWRASKYCQVAYGENRQAALDGWNAALQCRVMGMLADERKPAPESVPVAQVERFYITVYGDASWEPIANKHGDWVRYADHARIVADLQAQLHDQRWQHALELKRAEQAEASLAACRADAERWRKLRTLTDTHNPDYWYVHPGAGRDRIKGGSQLDAAIDAARGAS